MQLVVCASILISTHVPREGGKFSGVKGGSRITFLLTPREGGDEPTEARIDYRPEHFYSRPRVGGDTLGGCP